MTDRELLELAAEAVGIKGEWIDYWGFRMEAPALDGHGTTSYPWNSLTEERDAMHLLVTLRMNITFDDNLSVVSVEAIAGGYQFKISEQYSQQYKLDVPAAVRRAITRTAAEIQRKAGRS